MNTNDKINLLLIIMSAFFLSSAVGLASGLLSFCVVFGVILGAIALLRAIITMDKDKDK